MDIKNSMRTIHSLRWPENGFVLPWGNFLYNKVGTTSRKVMISLTRCSTIRPRRLNCDNHRLYELAIYFNLGGLPKYWYNLYALAPPVSPLTYPFKFIIIIYMELVVWSFNDETRIFDEPTSTFTKCWF